MRIFLNWGTAVFSATLVGALSLCAPALAGQGARDHAAAPEHKVTHSTSTNWSGYAVQGAGTYQRVSASWTQPAAECAKTPRGWSAFWVGLDGDTTSTVEQTGTEADCSSGKPLYYGWYEMYPKYPVNFANVVAPKDHLEASVTYLGGGAFRLTLSDTTQHWSQTTTQRLKSAKLGSAEVIAEAPSSNHGPNGELGLADFGAVSFTGATVNNTPLDSQADQITMVQGGTTLAQPSTISGGNFSIDWKAASGPPSHGRGHGQG